MFALLLSEEAWLNATNALLGIVVFACVVAIGGAIFHEVASRVRARAQARNHFVFDAHSVNVPDLGFTMADGGEPYKEDDQKK